jgi:hypothetical protein
VHPDDVVSLANQAKGNLKALARLLNHLAPDPESPTVTDLRTAARGAAVHHVTLGTSLGERHEAYHRMATGIADAVTEAIEPIVERLERERDGALADLTNMANAGTVRAEARRDALREALGAGYGTSWPALIRQVKELRARGEDTPDPRGSEQASPGSEVRDLRATLAQRERELKAAGEAKHQALRERDEALDDSARAYSQGVEDMREKAARTVRAYSDDLDELAGEIHALPLASATERHPLTAFHNAPAPRDSHMTSEVRSLVKRYGAPAIAAEAARQAKEGR